MLQLMLGLLMLGLLLLVLLLLLWLQVVPVVLGLLVLLLVLGLLVLGLLIPAGAAAGAGCTAWPTFGAVLCALYVKFYPAACSFLMMHGIPHAKRRG